MLNLQFVDLIGTLFKILFTFLSSIGLSDFSILIGNVSQPTSPPLSECYHQTQPSVTVSQELLCNTPLYGRYLHIVKDNPGEDIQLCEVVVIGRKVIGKISSTCSKCHIL